MRCLLVCILIASVACTETTATAQTLEQGEQALQSGLSFLKRREFDKARGPLEAALQLAPDDAFRLKVYRPLMSVYRTLPETQKMTEACEFILKHGDTLSDRSSAASGLASFYFQRGQADEQFKRYRDRATADADDYAAIAMTAELARSAGQDRAATETFRKQYDAAQRRLASQFAILEEQAATTDAAMSAWHWKEAAVLWSRAGDKEKALEAARAAEKAGPEKRSQILLHFWHAGLGDVYLSAESYADAARHLERAIAATTIDGYQKSCREKLQTAKEKLAAEQQR